jgi:hypothetical protein
LIEIEVEMAIEIGRDDFDGTFFGFLLLTIEKGNN